MSEALSQRAQGDVVVLGWRVWWFVGLWFPWRIRKVLVKSGSGKSGSMELTGCRILGHCC